MAADVKDVISAFGTPSVPDTITQKPFDYDPSHYGRLCTLGAKPDAVDLYSYADDLMYQEVQKDLFLFLLPICLSAWQEDLMASHESEYAGFVEQFSAVLAKHAGFRDLLSPTHRGAVSDFICNAILDKIDQECDLSFSGMGASPYSWILTIGTFGTAFPAVADLWREWWTVPSVGRACGVLQYASVLMYPDEKNPIFSPWTAEIGGGPPRLWETDGFIHDQSWLPENVDFMRSTFTTNYIRDAVLAATGVLRGEINSPVPQKMVSDFDDVVTFVELRLEELAQNLSLPFGEIRDWITE
ncbi:MAG: hypothetical protein GY851_22275 [bacterium]|nr:hypothetical protein [bacterium]